MPDFGSPELSEVDVAILRGGTSKGVFIKVDDMPREKADWEAFLIALFGAEDVRQIDGLGGGDQLTSKCCIVGPSSIPEAHVDYTFAQVGIGKSEVWWDINCGNLSSAVGVFAVQSGYVAPTSPTTSVRINQRNTERVLTVEVPTPDGRVAVEGDTHIDGVAGSGAGLIIDFAATAGATLDAGLLPTGCVRDSIDIVGLGALDCSIVDLGNLCVFFHARDFGFTGLEPPSESDRLRPTFHAVRKAAQHYLGSDPSRSTPWPISIAPAEDYQNLAGATVAGDTYDFAGRLIATDAMHKAYPGTGGCCTAVAAVTPGTIVWETYGRSVWMPDGLSRRVRVGHPSGVMDFRAAVTHGSHGEVVVRQASFDRTARILMHGRAYVRRRQMAELKARLSSGAPPITAVP